MMTANIKRQTSKGSASGAGTGDPFAGAYTFRSLTMWQRAQELTDEILDVASRLPSDRVTGIIIQQIVRSASSIGANIAEGHGRYTVAAYRSHLSIARGSTAETISWVDLLRRRRLITAEQEASLLSKCAEIMKMLTAKMIDLDRRNSTGQTVKDERGTYVAELFDV